MGEVSFVDVSKRFSLRVDGELHHVQALATARSWR
jgi:predicted HicB family RNase H-like nuclease